MCHGVAIRAFPEPAPSERFEDGVEGFRFGAASTRKLAILPDIYGCNDFYRGLATHLSNDAEVFLVDTFAGLGELPEMTREAAFGRRNKVSDKDFLDHFEAFARRRDINGVIGFCLGGLYVFELARRGLEADLIGLYGFPQGLPNQDPLPAPFDYLESVTQPFTMLLGEDDESVGADNIKRLVKMAPEVPAMALRVYEGVGHNFLPLLDSDDPGERAIAEDALAHIARAAA